MRIPIIGANWKMHKTVSETVHFAKDFPVDQGLFRKVEIVVFPPFTSLAAASAAFKGTGIKLGAQNMHTEERGAYTGEISPVMLLDVGCSYVLLGHSERRHLFLETNEFINKKVKSAIAHGLLPCLCIGETLEERRNGLTEDICKRQLLGSLAGVAEKDMAKMVIAYEPVWAIGTGENASCADAEKTISFIRSVIAGEFGAKVAEQVRIQYGGSVKPANAAEYFAQKNIDGALVGGASLETASFHKIIKSAETLGVAE